MSGDHAPLKPIGATSLVLSMLLASVVGLAAATRASSAFEKGAITCTYGPNQPPYPGACLFTNGAAYCLASSWRKDDVGGVVGCAARIGGVWQEVDLFPDGFVFKHRRETSPTGRYPYQRLRTAWHGGVFACTPVAGGIACSAQPSGHGFRITSQAITVRR